MMDVSDEQWMKVYQESGADAPEAFRALYQRYHARVLAYLTSKLGRTASRDEIQDVFQKVFFRFHQTRHRFDSAYLVAPWIFTLTRNTLIDHLRTSKKHLVSNADIDPDLLPAETADPVRMDETLDQTLEKIRGLTRDQQEALRLRYAHDAGFDEIAKKLKTSPANARQLISRGLKQARKIFKKGKSE